MLVRALRDNGVVFVPSDDNGGPAGAAYYVPVDEGFIVSGR